MSLTSHSHWIDALVLLNVHAKIDVFPHAWSHEMQHSLAKQTPTLHGRQKLFTDASQHRIETRASNSTKENRFQCEDMSRSFRLISCSFWRENCYCTLKTLQSSPSRIVFMRNDSTFLFRLGTSELHVKLVSVDEPKVINPLVVILSASSSSSFEFSPEQFYCIFSSHWNVSIERIKHVSPSPNEDITFFKLLIFRFTSVFQQENAEQFLRARKKQKFHVQRRSFSFTTRLRSWIFMQIIKTCPMFGLSLLIILSYVFWFFINEFILQIRVLKDYSLIEGNFSHFQSHTTSPCRHTMQYP